MSSQNEQKYNIICLSNQLWDFPNWTNKRHVMSRLGKMGHNVIFVDPPINTGRVFFRQVLRGSWGPKRLLTQQKVDETGVRVYTPLNLLPFPQITSKLHISRINKLSKKNFDPHLKTILWVYHVQIANLGGYVQKVDYDYLVYDCVDNYLGFPEDNTFYTTNVPKNKVEEQENMLTEKADVVFASAPGLVDKLKKHNENVHFTPNVGDYEKFKDAKKVTEFPEDIKDINRPIVAFTGALDSYKFDLELFKKLLADHPKYSFVLIGQIALKDKGPSLKDIGLEEFDNVYFLGQKQYAKIHNYYGAFDAYIIPYILNDYTVGGCFPVKFHEALAAGLPTIVTDMPAYSPFESVSYISKSYDEFSQNIKRALDEDSPEKIKQRQQIAKENTWDGKVDTLLGLIRKLSQV